MLYLLGNYDGSEYASVQANPDFTSGKNLSGSWLVLSNILFGRTLDSAESVVNFFSATLSMPISLSNNTAKWQSGQLTKIHRTVCSGNPRAGSKGCAGSNAPTSARLITSGSGDNQFIFTGYGIPNISGREQIGYSILSANSEKDKHTTAEKYISLSQCISGGSSTATAISAVTASSFESNPLFIAGTNSGDICLGTVSSSAEYDLFDTAKIINLTAKLKASGIHYTYKASPVNVENDGYRVIGGYNEFGAVNSIAATPQGVANVDTIIAWTQGNTKVYFASMTSNNTSLYTFADLTGSGYSNVPTNVSVIYVDLKNNIYVGTFDNRVYELPNVSTAWLSGTIPGDHAGYQIHNFSASYNGDVVYIYTSNDASVASSGKPASVVYSLGYDNY